MVKKLILLVEDDINLQQSITLVLHRAGYLVTATDCGLEVPDIAGTGKYDLIILDNDMPETQKMLLPRLEQCFPIIPIIILIDQPRLESKLPGAGSIHYFLSKPVAPEDLLENVQLIVE